MAIISILGIHVAVREHEVGKWGPKGKDSLQTPRGRSLHPGLGSDLQKPEGVTASGGKASPKA